jgi:dihydroorotase-like cyclic amidohydrolase
VWSSTNTASCTVSEDNAGITDAWSGTSGTQVTSSITTRTVYNLVCTGLDGSQASDSVVINVLPKWREI